MNGRQQTPLAGAKLVKLEVGDRYSFNHHHGRMLAKKHKPESRLLLTEMGPLNFSATFDDYEMHVPDTKKAKPTRDPMSHRIIEKRRRDRMNNCLANLSRLIPANYMKQGQGRIEKTEIIEMAIRHINYLQNLRKNIVTQRNCCAEKFYLGFKECEAEIIRYLVECEGLDSKDQLCARMINHLEMISKKFIAQNSQMQEFKKDEAGMDINQQMVAHNNGNSTLDQIPEQGLACLEASVSEEVGSLAEKEMSKQLKGLIYKDQHDSGNGTNESSTMLMSGSDSSSFMSPYEENGQGLNGTGGDSDEQGRQSCEGSPHGKDNIYKFKHDITKRFSQEEKCTIVCGSHENRMQHAREGKLKRKHLRAKSPSSSSDSTLYPMSEYSWSGSTNCISTNLHLQVENATMGPTNVPLPAFVLHPSGTHYLPITIQPSCLQESMKMFERPQQALIFHPVSVLVNFGSPEIVLRKSGFVSSEPNRNQDDC